MIALWRDRGLMVPLNDPAQDIALCRESGHGEIFVAAQDGEVVASVMVGHDGHRGWLYYLAVPKVELMIRESNAVVAAFWRRIGYGIELRTVMSRRLDGKEPR